MRSSSVRSAASCMISDRRWPPYFLLSSLSSVSMRWYTLLSSRINASNSDMRARNSSSSVLSFSSSSAVSRARVSRSSASACSSLRSNGEPWRASLAWLASFACLTTSMTSSICARALSSPSTTCARCFRRPSSKFVRRRIVRNRKSSQICRADLRVSLTGCLPSSPSESRLPANEVCSCVFLKRLFCTTVALASFLSSMTMRVPSRSLSSRRSAMPSSFFSFTIVAILSSSTLLLTMYGSSVTTIAVLDPSCPPFLLVFLISSTCVRARITTAPLPVLYSFRTPSSPTISAPVGKSGAGISENRRSSDREGFLMSAMHASTSSPSWCGGMLVAIPTAIPVAPFSSRKGSFAGRMVGSTSFPSKFATKSTVSMDTSANSASRLSGVSLHSVYLMAAGGSPSTDPKLPCPLTSGPDMTKSWAIRTRAS
mmetsp:Transcript_6804/g.19804  ORF Transcript_6804/g.19804 Transcript_6804/m.19804 type:complete len:427 (-) Transcript_6804:578-1858(-)